MKMRDDEFKKDEKMQAKIHKESGIIDPGLAARIAPRFRRNRPIGSGEQPVEIVILDNKHKARVISRPGFQ